MPRRRGGGLFDRDNCLWGDHRGGLLANRAVGDISRTGSDGVNFGLGDGGY